MFSSKAHVVASIRRCGNAKTFLRIGFALLCACLNSCAGFVQGTTKNVQAPINIFFSSSAISLQTSQSHVFTVTVQNDPQNQGVSWSLSGAGCSSAACGALVNQTPTSVTYESPAQVPNPSSVSLQATSITDPTRAAVAVITVTAAPQPISVSISPTSASVQVAVTQQFSAIVQNDLSNSGVLWSVNGVAGGTPTFGTISASGLYQAPAVVPTPATFNVSAVSQADNTKSASAPLTVVAATLPISVGVSPASTSVQVSQSSAFSASLQNDSQNKGVSWSLSGSGCSGASCGTLSAVTTSSVTYNAPAFAPSPASVSLKATAISDSTKSASAAITITSPPPSAPSNLSASANGSSEIDLSWSASSGSLPISSYLIERCLGSGCSNFAQVASSASSPFSDTGLAASSAYSYRVRASDSGNNLSPYSNTSSASTSASTSSGSTPTLVWSKSAANTTGVAMNSYTSYLPTNGTLSGNALIATFQYGAGSGASANVTDDKGDTLTLLKSNSDGNQILSTYCVLPTTGAHVLTITFSGGMPQWVSLVNASEWFNTTCSLDGSSGNTDATGSFVTSVSAGNLTTTVDGDLLYHVAVEDGSTNTEAWTQGASPWTLLSASRGLAGANLPQVAQYQVQATHGTLNPTLAMSSPDSWNSVAVALRSSSSGTPPAPGIRIVHMQEESIPPGQSSNIPLQFPSSGNLIISASNDGPDFDVAGISDGNGNSYTQIGSAFNDGSTSGDVQTFYAGNAVTSSTMSITFSMTGNPLGGSTFFLYDVTGAAASPYDSVAGRQTATSSQANSGNIAGPTITPSTANGLVIMQIAVTTNSVSGVSPGVFTATLPNPLDQTNPTDENNGWGIEYNATASARQYIWTTQGGAVQGWASTAVAFKAQ